MITIIFILTLIILICLFINKKKETFTEKRNKNLVFTSAGNNTNFHNLWTKKNRNYDIWVVYYGDNQSNYNLYKDKVNFIIKRKGSKFQNFHYVYNTYKTQLDKYERFFILDDDIIFNTNDINKMFNISKKYNLWLCGPTFKNNVSGKISHPITKQVNNNFLRYCNFVEVNVPLFNKYGLTQLMKYYDPILIGWGIDYLYIWALTHNKSINEYNRKIALVDKVTCINPHDNKKNNIRELNNISNVDKRANIWETFKKKYNIDKINKINYYSIKVENKYVLYNNNVNAGLSHLTSNLNTIIKEAYFNNETLIIPMFNLAGHHNNGKAIKSNLSKYYDYNNLTVNNKKFEVILDKNSINNQSIRVVNLMNQLSKNDKNIIHSNKEININLPYNKSIINKAKQISNILQKFMCIHIRRGDILKLKKNLNNDTNANGIIHKIHKYNWTHNIYIMTNEKDLSIYDPIMKKYKNKVYFYKDFNILNTIEDNYYLFCIEKEIMKHANIKISTFKTNGTFYDDYLSNINGWQ